MSVASLPAVLAERTARQGLVERADTGVVAAAGRCAGVQAQDVPAARLSVRSRTTGLTAADVEAAEGGALARTWLMRATLHWVPTPELPWLQRLLGPVVLAKYAPVRRQRGITAELVDTATQIVEHALGDGPLTRRDLTDALASRGVTVPTDNNSAAHLFGAMAAGGVLVRAPDRRRQPVYDLFDRWCAGAPPGPSGDDAVRELMVRYLAAFAPATAEDAAAWSGLGLIRVRAALAGLGSDTGEAEPDGRPLHRLGEPPPGTATGRRTTRLLAAFDTYLMGYRHRSGWLADEHRTHVVDGGWLYASVCVGGRLVGRWRLPTGDGAVGIELLPGERAPSRAALTSEIRDIGRFCNRDLELGDITELT